MRSADPLYRFAQVTLRAFTPLVGRGTSKLSRGMRGRLDAHERLVRWGAEHRKPGLPTVWVHAPSVGEGLQAQAVIEALAEITPGLQALFTHFSPSAEGLARDMPVACADYLPWDLSSAVGPVLDAVQPALLVFTKTEVWPTLVREAVRRGVPTALVAGTVKASSGRARWPARPLLRQTWSRLSAAGVLSEEDGAGLVELGVRPEVVVVTGDPAVDSAAHRMLMADPTSPLLAPFHARPAPTLIAGSTWPAGEAVLLPALASVRARVPGLRVVIAPHEPEPRRVDGLTARLKAIGFDATTLSAVETAGGLGSADAVIVDRVGPLARLYTVGHVAYVGGGFHASGLHSVLEPAAAGLPVVFGPGHQDAHSARGLLESGAAAVAQGPEMLAETVLSWLEDPDRLHYTGTLARGYIDAHLGAADRSAALLKRLMDQDTDQR
jgi:3-deoxy-D-manno-octulosonic-acid transferase